MRRIVLAFLIALITALVPAAAYWQSVLQVSVAGGTCTDTYDTSSCDIFAAFTTPPSTPRKVIINTYVLALKTCTTWTKIDAHYVMAAADSQAATINWKNPGTFTLSAVNSPGFTADNGFNSDGTTSYLTTSVAPGSFGVLVQDSAHIGGWVLGTGSTVFAFGRQNSSGNYSIAVNNGGAGTDAYRISANVFVSTSAAATAGYHLISRTGASTGDAYYNAGVVTVVFGTSSGIGSGNVQMLLSNGAFTPNTAKIAIQHWGSQMNSTEVTCTCQAGGAYMTSVGAIGGSPC